MKRTTTAVLLGAGMTLALAAGCGGDEEQAPTGECEESGISQACACPEGGTGVQLCLDDLSWSECQNCPAPVVDAGDTTPDAPIVDGCLSDDECGAYQCVGLSQSEPGECGTSCRIDRECNDGYECDAGVCVEVAPAGCTDDSECGGYRCDTAAGLCFTSCTDGSECTVGDWCVNGTCIPGQPQVCDDGNYCTLDLCNPLTGLCEYKPTGWPCDDDNACTTLDLCSQGACAGFPVNCADGTVCTSDSCDPEVGCLHTNVDGVLCDDSNHCTADDICQGGECVGQTSVT